MSCYNSTVPSLPPQNVMVTSVNPALCSDSVMATPLITLPADLLSIKLLALITAHAQMITME